jgi:hypothetical protein
MFIPGLCVSCPYGIMLLCFMKQSDLRGDTVPKYKVPANIQRIAKNAIEYNLSFPVSQRAAWVKDDEKKAGTGMRTARRLASGAIDEDQMRLMRAWFARHGASPGEKENRKDKTSKAARAWQLWGGSPAMRWVSSMLREIEKKKK